MFCPFTFIKRDLISKRNGSFAGMNVHQLKKIQELCYMLNGGTEGFMSAVHTEKGGTYRVMFSLI